MGYIGLYSMLYSIRSKVLKFTSVQSAEEFSGQEQEQVTRHQIFRLHFAPPLHPLSSGHLIENFQFQIHLTTNTIYLLPFCNILLIATLRLCTFN